MVFFTFRCFFYFCWRCFSLPMRIGFSLCPTRLCLRVDVYKQTRWTSSLKARTEIIDGSYVADELRIWRKNTAHVGFLSTLSVCTSTLVVKLIFFSASFAKIYLQYRSNGVMTAYRFQSSLPQVLVSLLLRDLSLPSLSLPDFSYFLGPIFRLLLH